jgi:multidrug resistance efflux pump
MKRSYLLPLLAITGLVIAVVVVVDNNRRTATQPPVIHPSISPYANYIAGSGIIEALDGNIDIGTPVSGIVAEIYAGVGGRVQAGDALFKIDDRDLQAALISAIATSELAKTAVQKPDHRLGFLTKLQQSDPGAVNARELSDLRDDLAEARASLALANAQVEQIRTEIALHTIRAPANGQILQLHARLGEYVEAASTPAPILVFGRDDTLWVRVDIDENAIWRFRPGSNALAYVRGNATEQIPLQFEYVEPYVVAKRSLTGQSTERTDTRVLQVLFSFDTLEQPVYVGQMLDVFIEATEP